MTPVFILTISCPDRRGIVAGVSAMLADRECSIIEAHQHQDVESDTFFMRIVFRAGGAAVPCYEELQTAIAPIAQRFGMDARLYDRSIPPRILVMVSRSGHCLNDLLHRWRSGHLPVDIAAVVSNHDDLRAITEWHGLAYHHLPVAADNREAQERSIVELVEQHDVDLVVLARYMQILSPRMCEFLSGRCINIHHSFLPGFKGARPYHQAHARGVKIIGATAHYVTTDLDEGPIIEQDTRRVSHARSADDLVRIGEEIECSVLARAVEWQAERRVLLNGRQTIIFY